MSCCVTVQRVSAPLTTPVRAVVQGQVLNETSAWWMGATRHIAANALLDVPDPNVSVMRKCTVLPVEFVVRGFMTGAPSTLCMQKLVCYCCFRLKMRPCKCFFLGEIYCLLVCNRRAMPVCLPHTCCHAASIWACERSICDCLVRNIHAISLAGQRWR